MLPAGKRPWSCRKERIKFQKNHPSYRTIIGAKDGEKTLIGCRPRPYGLMDFGALGLWGVMAASLRSGTVAFTPEKLREISGILRIGGHWRKPVWWGVTGRF